jgi:hypothetical protein
VCGKFHLSGRVKNGTEKKKNENEKFFLNGKNKILG